MKPIKLYADIELHPDYHKNGAPLAEVGGRIGCLARELNAVIAELQLIEISAPERVTVGVGSLIRDYGRATGVLVDVATAHVQAGLLERRAQLKAALKHELGVLQQLHDSVARAMRAA